MKLKIVLQGMHTFYVAHVYYVLHRSVLVTVSSCTVYQQDTEGKREHSTDDITNPYRA